MKREKTWEEYTDEEKSEYKELWSKEKPLIEKVENINISIGFGEHIKEMFFRKDVAHAVDRLKEELRHGLTGWKDKIDEIFGDLKQEGGE